MTKAETHFIQTRWMVSRSTFESKKRSDFIVSPTFKSPSSLVEWHLKVYPRGFATEKGDATSIYLYSNSTQRLQAKYECRLENCLGINPSISYCISAVFEKENSNSGRRAFALRNTILEEDAGYCEGGALMFYCRVEFEPLPCLKTSLSSLINRTPFKDITNLQTSNFDCYITCRNVEMRASMRILARHSSVLKTLFDESDSTRTFCIEDFEPAVVQKALNYCHYDKQPVRLDEDANELFQFAHKYDIPGLKVICQKYIQGVE